MRYVSMHSGHDMNISLFEDGCCVYHLELERLYNIKHYGWSLKSQYNAEMHANLMPTLLNHVLPTNGWKPEEIEALCIDGIQWSNVLYQNNGLMKALRNANYSTDPRRVHYHGRGVWMDRDMEVCALMHHLSHMAYSYYTGPFEEALIFCYDGLGEFDINTTWGIGRKNKILYRGDFRHRRPRGTEENSIGFFYSCLGHIIQFLYANTMDAPGKAMGLSSYGKPRENMRLAVRNKLRSYIRTWPDMKSIVKDLHFDLTKFQNINSEIAKDFMATVQDEAEIYVLETISKLVERTGIRDLCMGGGCALNVCINQRLLDEKVVDRIYIPPACSDTGLALGNGYYYWHHVLGHPFDPKSYHSPYLGDYVQNTAVEAGPDIDSHHYNDPPKLCEFVASKLVEGQIVAWAQGRSEIGPRALGNRSILANPSISDMKDRINEQIKHREYWRPFAPVCMAEHASEWFETDFDQPYMLLSPKVKEDKKHLLPAVTHVDGTARLQTVRRKENPKLYMLLNKFYEKTGVPILLNTSLNDRGKPIANQAPVIIDLVRKTGLNMAVIGSTIYTKKQNETVNLPLAS